MQNSNSLHHNSVSRNRKQLKELNAFQLSVVYVHQRARSIDDFSRDLPSGWHIAERLTRLKFLAQLREDKNLQFKDFDYQTEGLAL